MRGKVIPIVQMRRKFGMSDGERTSQTCIIVVDVDGVEMGIVVDRVLEVLDIAAADIEDSPSFGADVDTSYINGICKVEGHVTILLDIEGILSGEEIAALAGQDELISVCG